jgi:hypothetical protein
MRKLRKRHSARPVIDLCASMVDLGAASSHEDSHDSFTMASSSASDSSPSTWTSRASSPTPDDTASISSFSTTTTYASSMTVRDPHAEHLKKFVPDDTEEDADDYDRATLCSVTSGGDQDNLSSPISQTAPDFLACVAIPRMLNCVPIQPWPDHATAHSVSLSNISSGQHPWIEVSSGDSDYPMIRPSPPAHQKRSIRLSFPWPAVLGHRANSASPPIGPTMACPASVAPPLLSPQADLHPYN